MVHCYHVGLFRPPGRPEVVARLVEGAAPLGTGLVAPDGSDRGVDLAPQIARSAAYPSDDEFIVVALIGEEGPNG